MKMEDALKTTETRLMPNLLPGKPCSRVRLFLAVAILFQVLILAFDVAAAKKPPKMPSKPKKIAAGNPEIFQLEPRGIQRGVPSKVKLIGTNLVGLTVLELHNPNLKGSFLSEPEATTNEAWIEITAAANLARGAYEVSVRNTNSESSRLKFYVDDLPQAYENSPSPAMAGGKKAGAVLKLPVSFWGTLDPPGDADEIEFEARVGDSVIFDLAAQSIGSKARPFLTLFDEKGAWLASNNGFDSDDPLLSFTMPATGHYRVRIGERTDAGSKDHFYRLSMGTFPMVVGCFPSGVPANKETKVALIGFNLPPGSAALLKAHDAGELDVRIDSERFRVRKPLKVIANDGPELVEIEPNDAPGQATKIPVPAVINGRIWAPEPRPSSHASRAAGAPGGLETVDVDFFQFEARARQALVIETDAARRGSPVDTKIEILYPDGKPVERLLLQAVRDSHVTFRPIDSNTDDLRVENWQEMELNQLMYLQGEVCKIFRMPQGPDSGFQFYNIGGKRREYFNTSPVSHPLDEPIYIVEPHAPGSKLVPNGLPVFTLYYANDDDGERKLGSDSSLLFTAPADGPYLVRVSDARGHGGERFVYRLIVREAKPDFKVTLAGANPTINAGSGKEFSVTAERIDGFDGDITVDITNLPPGFVASTPLVIQAGHLEAKGTILAPMDAAPPGETNAAISKVTASAVIHSRPLTRAVNSLGKIKLGEKPKLFVSLEPYDEHQTNFVERSLPGAPLEITVAPGHSVPAWLKIKRNGFDELVTFGVESLPHGVIVDNIGLNGVLIPKDQNQRQIFLTAARWVPEVDRLCFAQAKQADNPTSLPIMIHVRRTATQASASAP